MQFPRMSESRFGKRHVIRIAGVGEALPGKGKVAAHAFAVLTSAKI